MLITVTVTNMLMELNFEVISDEFNVARISVSGIIHRSG
jgi:hypothetical protein